MEAAIRVVQVNRRHLPEDMSGSSTDGTNEVQGTRIAELADVDERCNEEHLKRVQKRLGVVTKDLCGRLNSRSRVVLLILMGIRVCHTQKLSNGYLETIDGIVSKRPAHTSHVQNGRDAGV